MAERRTIGSPPRGGIALGSAERDPANELYDQACSLLEAAQGLRAAAGSWGLRSLHSPPRSDASKRRCRSSATSFSKLRDTALTTPADADPDDGENPWEPVRIRANFALLARDLSNSRTSCAAVRRLVGPALAKRWA